MALEKVIERPFLTTPIDGSESTFVAQLMAVLQQHGYYINNHTHAGGGTGDDGGGIPIIGGLDSGAAPLGTPIAGGLDSAA